MQSDRPLTLTVEQAGRLLGVGRSTAYELVRSGDLECLRLRRRVVVPTARIADRLGLTLAEVWEAIRTDTVDADESGRTTASERHTSTRTAPRRASLF